MSARHVVLLGDSIFDNATYTVGELDVVSHLRAMLPDRWRATLLAVDGATISSIPLQLRRVPADATDLVVAVGGNDALMNQNLLAMPVRSTTEALALFASRIRRFEADYRSAIDAVVALARPTTVCTIYNGNLEEPRAAVARIGLMMFNDVILRTAFERQLTVIELRLVCRHAEDYTNLIEPSGVGGRKIADAVVRAIRAPGGGARVIV